VAAPALLDRVKNLREIEIWSHGLPDELSLVKFIENTNSQSDMLTPTRRVTGSNRS